MSARSIQNFERGHGRPDQPNPAVVNRSEELSAVGFRRAGRGPGFRHPDLGDPFPRLVIVRLRKFWPGAGPTSWERMRSQLRTFHLMLLFHRAEHPGRSRSY